MDTVLRERAKREGHTILTEDSAFSDMSIWVKLQKDLREFIESLNSLLMPKNSRRWRNLVDSQYKDDT